MTMNCNCPTCNQQTEDGAAFCGNCGQQLRASAIRHAAQTPAYAVALPISHVGETKALLSVICGCFGLIGAVIPLTGMTIGIVGIILGTTTRARNKRESTAGIIISSIAVLASLGVWTFLLLGNANAQQASANKNSQSAVATVAASSVTTPCYEADFSGQLNITTTQDSCDMQAYNGATLNASSVAYKVYGYQQPSLSEANFMTFAKQALEKDVRTNLSGFTVQSQAVGQFAGRPAYFVNAIDKDGVAYVEAAVLRSDGGDTNVFVFVHAAQGDKVNLGEIEAGWRWK